MFALRYAAGLMDDALCQGQDLQCNRALQALIAGLKAYSTWENVACLQDCRECTGGMVSTCVALHLNTHIYTDTNVMWCRDVTMSNTNILNCQRITCIDVFVDRVSCRL